MNYSRRKWGPSCARALRSTTRCGIRGARAGELVAVHGIGGLGHLGIQYARQMGFVTVALGRGKDKEPLAKKLGAHHYIDSGAGDAAAELQKLGGACVILATAPNAKAISALVDGLSPSGKVRFRVVLTLGGQRITQNI